MRLTELTERHLFVRTVELLPPGFDVDDPSKEPVVDVKSKFRLLVEKALRVEAIADAVHIADLKDSLRYRMNAITAAVDLKRETGIETIPAVPLRDYNKNVLYGLIFHALNNSIENFLLVRGDPYTKQETRHASNVYDIKRVSSLVKMVRSLSERLHDMKCCILGPLNLNRNPSEHYLHVTKEREQSGTDMFLSQPIFEDVETCLERVEIIRSHGIRKPVLHNIFPLKSYEDAIYCEQRFGISIPRKQKQRVKEGGIEEALRTANQRYHSLLEHRKEVDGVYVSSRGVAEWALRILS